MLNSLRDGQINYGTTNCPSAHVTPHNVASIHQNSLISTEPSTPVYQWNANHRLEHLYGFHSRYYNLDFPTPYPSATNQYVPTNVYGQNLPQCCQPCCRLRSQNIPKASPPQMLYNPRPVQQLNRSYKSKKTLKTPCSEQFLPYIPNDLPVKYDTQNCYQQKYSSSYLNNTNYCPPANNLWIPPAANPNWSNDRLRPTGRHTRPVSHDFSREKNYQRLPNYQGNPYSKPTSAANHIPYNYIPPLPDVHDYRPPVYHNPSKNNTTEYVSHDHSSRFPILSQNIQNPSSLQQYYNTQPVPYSDVQMPSESFKPPQITPKDTSKSNLNVREFLATWDEGEEEIGEKSSETAEPIVVLDCMTLDGDALTKIQEKLNVVSYENLEKVLKENQNPLVITAETNAINSLNNKPKLPSKSNFEPLDYTKRETGIIKPFITEKKISPELNSQSEKNYSVNFDGMVAWYGKKNTDISSTDLIERLADRIFNLSKSQENEGVSFGTAAYTGQITQTNRSIESSDKSTSKYIQSPQMFDLQHHVDKFIEPPIMNKLNCNKDSIPKVHSYVFNESNKASTIKSKNVNSSCIVENITKKCLNVTNEETSPWHLDQGVHEQHLNTSLYDQSVIMKPLDFSSLTDETKGNPFVFEKITSSDNKPNDSINNQCNKVFNQNNSYNSIVSNNQHSIQQIDACNRNFPVIVSPHRQEYNGFHESVIQRTGCDKNKHDKVSTQTDFESINWNLSNDLDKIMKNTNMIMEPSCLYDRSNYNILDGMNSEKNISTRWKDNVPCVDLTVNNKSNSHHDSFFDGWSFIESYENHSGKKIMNTPSIDNSHHQLFPNQMTPLEESTKNNNNLSENHRTNDTLVVKDMPPFSKSNDLLPSNRPSRDVFNLNNRIPDFSDGFELPVINEPQEYLQFKKDDNEHRADGSIFEHLNEPKCITTLNETLNYKNDQNKLDFVGLPSFKEKEPLAPVSAPSKLNIVKPTLRDPSQIYTVIKQKLKYDNTCVDNDSVVTNTTENNLKENLTNTFNVTDLKSKYNSGQLNQFDVWSEKFVLKGNSNSSSCAVVQCDVEITQFKSTPENRNTLPKSNMSENYQDKTMMLPENTNCNLADGKINIIENDKINSNDFLNCLESTKTDDQKYRDTFDEFETSFGFDIHCNNESNKSFHEDIVDKCFEERINDHEINKVESINSSDTNTTLSNSTQLPFQCDFQSSFLIKNYFDENKNKTVVLDQQETSNHEKSDTTIFKYHNENLQEFELQNNENIHSVINSANNSDFNMDCHVRQIHNANKNNNSNKVESYKCQHEDTKNICNISSIKKNNFDYLNIEDRNFGFDNNKKSILESEISQEITAVNNSIEADSISQIKHNDLNTNERFHIRKNLNVDFESNIFELNSKSTSKVIPIETNKKDESARNKNSFKSKLNSNNAEEIEHNINRKIIFELDNNNSGIHNLEKMNAFDFNTRTIQNLGIECSSINIGKSSNSNEIFTNESQMETNCGFEINDHKNKEKLETNYKNTLDIQEELQIEETSDLNCNNDAQRHNLIETENINHENNVDRVFEVGCIVNNVQDKLNLENPKTLTDFDFQNKNTENNNLNNCNTGENSNRSNNLEVENIFVNIYDNLSTLHTKKNDTNILENSSQNDIKCDVSKCQEITEDLNLKNNNSDVIDKICEQNMEVLRDASDKQIKETDNVLVQKLVNNSTDRMATVSVQHNESINYEKSKPTLIEYSTDDSNMNKNPAMSVKQHTEDIKEGDIQSNNWQPIKKMKSNAVQGNATLNIFENLRCNILNAVKNTDKKEYTQNNCSESSSFNPFVLNSQQNSNEIYEVKDSINSGPCTLSHVELIHHQNSNEVIEIKGLNSYGPNLLNHGESISQQRSAETVQPVDLTSSRPNLFHYDESITMHRSEETVDAIDLTCSGFSSLNHDEQPIEMLIAKNSNNPQLISVNHDESTSQKNSNNIYEIEDSITPRLSSLSHTELINNQNSNAVDEIGSSIKCESYLLNNELTFQKYSDEIVENDSVSSLKHDELKYHKHLNEINEVEDSISSGPNLINQDELEFQQNSNEIYESDDLNSSGTCSINQDELEFKQNSNEIYESDDLNSSGPCSINQDELEFQQNSNEIYKSEDLTSSESCSINQGELKYHQNLNEIYEVEDSTRSRPSSKNQGELKYHQNLNEIYEVEDSTRSRPSSKNQVELEIQQNSNAIYKSEDLTSSESCSINLDELEFQKNSNETDVADDLHISGPSPLNQDGLELQSNSNETDKAEDLTTSEHSSLNQDELIYHQNANEIYEVEESTRSRPSSTNQDELDFQQNLNQTDVADNFLISGPSPINKDKLEFQQNSNAIYESEDLTSSGSCSINRNELEFQQNANEIYEAGDFTRSRPISINQGELIYRQNLNEIYEVEDSTSSGSCSINQEELDFQQNSNETDVADDLHISGPSSLNQDRLEFKQNSNDIYECKDLTSSINQDELELQPNSNETDKAEDLTTSEHSSLNQDELKCQQNSNTINDSEDLTTSEPSIVNQDELEFQHNSNEIYEAVDLTISRPSLLNPVEYKNHNNLNTIIEDEDLIGSVGSFLNHNELICQEMFVEPSIINNSAIFEHNLNETNHDSCTKETDSKSVADDKPLPRVKFILKCHRKNMIKTNIFDEESTMPYKKLKVVKDEKIMTRHIFKKRIGCYKQYKPWQSEYRKESIVESNDRNQIESIETTVVPPTTSHSDNIVEQVQTMCEGKKDNNKFVSLLGRTNDHDKKRDVEVLNISVGIEGDHCVEGDTIDDGDYNRLLDTPIPSPFSDFQSEDHTPEHCGGEVYWDKSLEDEYKSVLHKTISKLAKVRTNVRDKFNSRLLARRVNETKRRRRRRLLVADKAAVVIVGRVDDPVIKPVVAAVKVSKSPMYKIKVQLPWGRIFNMNAVRNKTKDTKIELGPAKVEVRLSRTPGEWQVAACRSMTSSKSVVVVRRIVLQRATSPTANDYNFDDHHHNQRHDDGGHGTSDNRSHELSRKLPKIVIRRNGQDNNYTSYVRSSGFESGGKDEDGGGDNKKDGCGDVEDNGGGSGVPQLMVRLVRDRKLDAMAVEGVTTLHLKHLVPLSESEAEAAMELDMHCAKRVRYS
ncbi:protein PF3D7_1417600-like [Metopolophium dirhodum]|uniref:protein PF3D7_1417600-like n=1 Tax=Metopolophium dirhodum TaxID=44670 RepID=UPI00298F40BD|nr:protein PF3D7_1417600-like [Metopolophium dirhodum]XP_060860812.1 protein PF3D7_1417600-like [Metopolophium dirhodum]